MTIKKTLLTGFSLLTAIGLAGTPAAFAASDTTSIINSGDDAHVTTSSTSTTSVNVSNKNVADIQQQVEARVNTGHNTASGNISLDGGMGTSIETGNAAAQVGMNVSGNHNDTAVALGSTGGDTNLTDIVNTGNNAAIDTSATSHTNVAVSNNNQAQVRQNVDIAATSGGNQVKDNIGNGPSISTGNAGAVVGLQADLNHNMTAIGLGSESSTAQTSGEGNFTSVVNTGNDLDSNTSVNSHTAISSSSYNKMNLMQRFMSRTNSGNNTSHDNIGGASQTSGSAGVQVGLSSTGNHNSSVFGDIMDLLFFWMS